LKSSDYIHCGHRRLRWKRSTTMRDFD